MNRDTVSNTDTLNCCDFSGPALSVVLSRKQLDRLRTVHRSPKNWLTSTTLRTSRPWTSQDLPVKTLPSRCWMFSTRRYVMTENILYCPETTPYVDHVLWSDVLCLPFPPFSSTAAVKETTPLSSNKSPALCVPESLQTIFWNLRFALLNSTMDTMPVQIPDVDYTNIFRRESFRSLQPKLNVKLKNVWIYLYTCGRKREWQADMDRHSNVYTQ